MKKNSYKWSLQTDKIVAADTVAGLSVTSIVEKINRYFGQNHLVSYDAVVDKRQILEFVGVLSRLDNKWEFGRNGVRFMNF